MKVENYTDITDALCSNAGYPVMGVCQDGGVLCHTCMVNEENLIRDAIEEADDPQWRVEAVEIYWEGETIPCDHCLTGIESAYGDPAAVY